MRDSRLRRVSAAFCALVIAMSFAGGAVATEGAVTSDGDGVEASRVVEIVVPDRDELDRLVESGADLGHEISRTESGIAVQAVVTATEQADLESKGFAVGDVLFTRGDAEARLDERQATIQDKKQESQELMAELQALAEEEGEVVQVMRADYFESRTGNFLSVEAVSSEATAGAGSPTLTVAWDSGPGTAMGSGGTIALSRFVDAGTYMYHRRQFSVAARPEFVRVTSSNGGSASRPVTEWLPNDVEAAAPGYQRNFIDHYMTPTELYARIEMLADEFPQLTDIVNLPNKTNGYRRKSAATIGSTSGGGPAAVVVESRAWGHEGGDNITVQFVNPGAANQPLTVNSTGSAIEVRLGTSSTGALNSTAAQVIAALNAGVGDLVRAFRYRTSSMAGIVQASSLIRLDDFLNAPASVSREPFQVRALRIGKHRDGSRIGVLAYAQEHAREWVPPMVTIETAERLLRNYATDARTRKLLNHLDIFIVPSVNPDGGHRSFYDDTSQRKNMTNRCSDTQSDPGNRNDWGVDNNRNYTIGTLFDGYSGASSSCTNDVYSGPSELSEPESANVVWLAETYDNIKFSMNLHSSGNYFMWSPGAYRLPGRVLLPRPSLGDELFFWGSSEYILGEIKEYRGSVVTPAQTGPIADVLYSAAGNSGDELWYRHGVYAWNFETGTAGFQPVWATEGHAQAMEFANGLFGLLEVAYNYDRDTTSPTSTLVLDRGAGFVDFGFNTSEPATVFYTTDGSRPTTSSARFSSGGIRQLGEELRLTTTSTIKWFSVDAAGNTENGYNPASSGKNFEKQTVTVP